MRDRRGRGLALHLALLAVQSTPRHSDCTHSYRSTHSPLPPLPSPLLLLLLVASLLRPLTRSSPADSRCPVLLHQVQTALPTSPFPFPALPAFTLPAFSPSTTFITAPWVLSLSTSSPSQPAQLQLHLDLGSRKIVPRALARCINSDDIPRRKRSALSRLSQLAALSLLALAMRTG